MNYFDGLKGHTLSPKAIDQVNERIKKDRNKSLLQMGISTGILILILVILIITKVFANPMIPYALILLQVVGFIYLYFKTTTAGICDEFTNAYRGRIVKLQKVSGGQMAGVQFSNNAVFFAKVNKDEFKKNETVYVVDISKTTRIIVRNI